MYMLYCSQQLDGGLRDKPGKYVAWPGLALLLDFVFTSHHYEQCVGRPRDFYHTCYGLSGLSIAQHGCGDSDASYVHGDIANLVAKTSPLFNIGSDKTIQALRYFNSKPTGHQVLMDMYNSKPRSG
jgi:protein farnesyltransferase subunit beta